MSALKVARLGASDPPAPAHLSEKSRVVWAQVVADYGMAEDVSGLHILASTLESEDLAEAARQRVARDGEYIKARGNEGGLVPHPMIRVMVRARSEARAGWKQLALAPPGVTSARGPGRPPRSHGVASSPQPTALKTKGR